MTFAVHILWHPRRQQWICYQAFKQLGAFDRIDQAEHYRASLEDDVIDLDAPLPDPETAA